MGLGPYFDRRVDFTALIGGSPAMLLDPVEDPVDGRIDSSLMLCAGAPLSLEPRPQLLTQPVHLEQQGSRYACYATSRKRCHH